MLKQAKNSLLSRSIKDHYRERQLLTHRSLVALVIVVFLLLGLVARAWYLQVIKFEDYQTRSNNNRITVLPIAPKRGLISDRNGVLLAENRSVYALTLTPEKVNNLQQTLSALIELGVIDADDQEKYFEREKGERRFKSILLKNELREEEVARFSAARHQFPGVKIEAQLVRHYPFAEQLVHALGYVGRINDRELATLDETNYKATRHIGKVGIEKYYEDLLHGKVGFRQVETDVQGRVIGKPLFEKLPIPGANIRLSLDIRLQQVATQALKGFRGGVVAVDPSNGEVLALVSTPSYDPNDFVTGISVANYQKIANSEARPLFNRALRGLYSPGSTIKPHLGWVGLELGLIDAQSKVADPGFWVIPNKEERQYRDWKKGGHGEFVSLHQAIVESCDPFFYDLAYRMGIDVLSEQMQRFGFGDYTGIDMGEEVPGIMPSRSWKRANRKQPWFPGETVITGIGQGYWNATPLQLANSIAQLGSGSKRYRLHLATHFQGDDSLLTQLKDSAQFEPGKEQDSPNNNWNKVTRELLPMQHDFSNRENAEQVHKAMAEVTLFPRGTAKTAFRGASYRSAGKTGTVQLVSQTEEDAKKTPIDNALADNAMYIGYAPLEQPEIALAVVVENAGHGGEEAAPIARAVLDEFFRLKAMRLSGEQ